MRIPDAIATKAKAWIAAAGLVATTGSEVLADNVIAMGEVGTIVTVLSTAVVSVLAVYGVGNRPDPKATVRR